VAHRLRSYRRIDRRFYTWGQVPLNKPVGPENVFFRVETIWVNRCAVAMCSFLLQVTVDKTLKLGGSLFRIGWCSNCSKRIRKVAKVLLMFLAKCGQFNWLGRYTFPLGAGA